MYRILTPTGVEEVNNNVGEFIGNLHCKEKDLSLKLLRQEAHFLTELDLCKERISRRNQQIKDLNKNLSLSELNLHNYRLSLEGERAKLTIINR